jgi:hypothetical protein
MKEKPAFIVFHFLSTIFRNRDFSKGYGRKIEKFPSRRLALWLWSRRFRMTAIKSHSFSMGISRAPTELASAPGGNASAGRIL